MSHLFSGLKTSLLCFVGGGKMGEKKTLALVFQLINLLFLEI